MADHICMYHVENILVKCQRRACYTLCLASVPENNGIVGILPN